MAYNTLDFDASVENVGQKYSPKEKLGRIIKMVLTPTDFTFSTQSEAETETNWQDAIEAVSSRIYPLPFVWENEDQSEDAVYQDFTSGSSLKVRDGRYAERMQLYISVADMVKLASFKNKSWRAFEVDENGNILGTSPDGTIFKGFEVDVFDVEKMMRTAGDANRMVPIYVKYREPSEWTDYGVALQPLELSTDAWDPRDLDALTDVELSVVSSTTAKVVVKAEAYLKGVLIEGLSATSDWEITDDAGDAVSVSAVTDNGDGTYDISATLTAGTYNVDLADPATLGIDGYESTGSKEFTTS